MLNNYEHIRNFFDPNGWANLNYLPNYVSLYKSPLLVKITPDNDDYLSKMNSVPINMIPSFDSVLSLMKGNNRKEKAEFLLEFYAEFLSTVGYSYPRYLLTRKYIEDNFSSDILSKFDADGFFELVDDESISVDDRRKIYQYNLRCVRIPFHRTGYSLAQMKSIKDRFYQDLNEKLEPFGMKYPDFIDTNIYASLSAIRKTILKMVKNPDKLGVYMPGGKHILVRIDIRNKSINRNSFVKKYGVTIEHEIRHFVEDQLNKRFGKSNERDKMVSKIAGLQTHIDNLKRSFYKHLNISKQDQDRLDLFNEIINSDMSPGPRGSIMYPKAYQIASDIWKAKSKIADLELKIKTTGGLRPSIQQEDRDWIMLKVQRNTNLGDLRNRIINHTTLVNRDGSRRLNKKGVQFFQDMKCKGNPSYVLDDLLRESSGYWGDLKYRLHLLEDRRKEGLPLSEREEYDIDYINEFLQDMKGIALDTYHELRRMFDYTDVRCKDIK